MNAGRAVRLPVAPGSRGFTMVEMLVVIVIVLILASATIPAVGPMMESRDLAQAGQMVVDQIVAARQMASARNTTVEVCLVQADKSSSGYSALQLRATSSSGVATPLSPPVYLPGKIAISSMAPISPFLHAASLGSGSLRLSGSELPYVSFKIRSSGTVEPMPASTDRAKLYFTLVAARYATSGALPSNYILVQLNPDSGSPLVYRP